MSVTPSTTLVQRLQQALLGGVVHLLLWILKTVPWRWRRWVSQVVGRRIARSSRRRHNAARVNLDLAFGDSMPAERKEQIVEESFINFVNCTLDAFALVPSLTHDNWSNVVTISPDDQRTLLEAQSHNKGVLVMFSHYGAWELMGAVMPLITDRQTHVVAKRQEPWINPFIERFRSATGTRVIYKDGAVRNILRALKAGELVGLSIDQNFSRGIFVPFFGVRAGTVDTLAALSRASGAPVVPLICTPDGDGTYSGRLLPTLWPVKTDDKQADLIENTCRAGAVLEEVIRDRPELWLWGHKRWKTRPPDEQPQQDFYASDNQSAKGTP